MNFYLKTFQNITQSVDETLTVKSNSVELKQSATKLKESVQPCYEELRQSASRLKDIVQVCLDDLHHAEDVWNSKPKIAQAPTLEILEQIGELTGRDIRITQLGKQCRYQAVEQAKTSWESRIERLRKKWFIDAKQQLKKGVGFGEKEGFIKDIRPELNNQLLELDIIIGHKLSLVLQEINIIHLREVHHLIDLLNRQTKAELSNKLNLRTNEIENRFSKPTQYIRDDFNGFRSNVIRALELLVNRGMMEDIYWWQVVDFKSKISIKIEKTINSIFDDVELVNKAIAQAIAFYNDFLEQQTRYQQETPEQREAEKVWIDQQRRELEQVQQGIEVILNQSAG